jgi:hypothetical protein
MKLSDFREALIGELGEKLYDIVGDKPFERWVNVGQTKLGSFVRKTVTVTWAAGDTQIALPADWRNLDHYSADVGSCGLPSGNEWGAAYVFTRPATAGGSGTFFYYGERPAITGSSPSTLNSRGDEALISYCLYRFFKRLAGSRTDYRMYATITQSNGVDIAELDDIGERHLQDFQAAQDDVEPLRSTTFYEV